MTTKDEVLDASKELYDALRAYSNGNAGPMSKVWLHDGSVTLGQPMGAWWHGWDTIAEVWEAGARRFSNGKLTIAELTVQTHGDVGYTAGVETVTLTIDGCEHSYTAQVTDIFRKVNGELKLVHRHVDRVPRLPEVPGDSVPAQSAGQHDDLRDATLGFYVALNEFLAGNTSRMKDVWLDDEAIMTAHPLGTWATGRATVLESWDVMLPLFENGGRVDCKDLDLHVLADDMAYTLCVEDVDLTMAGDKRLQFTCRTTNIFRKVGGTWLLVHHHVDRAHDLQDAAMG